MILLKDLHPVIETARVLVFDCPNCGAKHRVRLRLGDQPDEWKMSGELPEISLHTSAELQCCDLFITAGIVKTC